MIIINEKKCIGCGSCVRDCFPNDLLLKNGKAVARNTTCIECGHCIAICPVDAVSLSNYDMAEVKAYDADHFDLSSEKLLNAIKFRRSVRQFKDQPIEKEKLEQIIEAGRFTPTASNRQPVSYIVVQEGLNQLTALALESLSQMGSAILNNSENTTPILTFYAKRWIQMYADYLENPQVPTGLFFNASAVILVVSDSPVDAALAASSMELMTHAEDLGMFYSGFFVRAAKGNPKIKKYLDIPPLKEVVTCLVMGYPEVEYQRTVPRKKATISWQ